MKIIAHIENDLPEKFGLPRQSGLVDDIYSTIVFEPLYRNPDAIRGLEKFSHIWLLWAFEGFDSDSFSPTVRPPKLGGNERVGVFATRSPNRPNPIGLSCVRLVNIEDSARGPIITVAGADLKNNSAIYDIKPYLPYADSHPEALGGFTDTLNITPLEVDFPKELRCRLLPEKIKAAISLLSQDPRPSYHNDPNREYGMSYAGYNIRFRVENKILHVINVEKESIDPHNEE